jgi:hypothetical protein
MVVLIVARNAQDVGAVLPAAGDGVGAARQRRRLAAAAVAAIGATAADAPDSNTTATRTPTMALTYANLLAKLFIG